MEKEQKIQLAKDILRNKMSDSEFDEYVKNWIDVEEITERIEDNISNVWEDEELDEFITTYNN